MRTEGARSNYLLARALRPPPELAGQQFLPQEWAKTGTLNPPPLVRTPPAPTVTTMETNNKHEGLARLLGDIAYDIKGVNKIVTLDVLETRGAINDGKRSYTDENIAALKEFILKQGMTERIMQLLEDIVAVLHGGDLEEIAKWQRSYRELMKEGFGIAMGTSN